MAAIIKAFSWLCVLMVIAIGVISFIRPDNKAADRARFQGEKIYSMMRKASFSGERAGYFYGWLLHSSSCAERITESDVLTFKNARNLADYVSKNAREWTGFDAANTDGEIDARRFISENGMNIYCAATINISQKVSFSFLNEVLN
jgi:hypothetical protein